MKPMYASLFRTVCAEGENWTCTHSWSFRQAGCVQTGWTGSSNSGVLCCSAPQQNEASQDFLKSCSSDGVSCTAETTAVAEQEGQSVQEACDPQDQWSHMYCYTSCQYCSTDRVCVCYRGVEHGASLRHSADVHRHRVEPRTEKRRRSRRRSPQTIQERKNTFHLKPRSPSHNTRQSQFMVTENFKQHFELYFVFSDCWKQKAPSVSLLVSYQQMALILQTCRLNFWNLN